jgi:restriction endonuclease S subunit
VSGFALLGEFLAKSSRTIVPNATPDETFELYSVPAFESRRPEIASGREIRSNKQVVEPGTVLLCKINPRINRAWYVAAFSPNKKIASTEWLTFPPNEKIEPKFLAYYLSRAAIRKFLAANASGVGGSLMRVKGRTVEEIQIPLPRRHEQQLVVAEIEKQFSRLDEAVANLQRVKANIQRYERATIEAMTRPNSFEARFSGTIADLSISLDSMRKPVNKQERTKRLGNIPYLGANGQTGWIDAPIFDEELVLVVEDETFVGRTAPFCYYFAGKCWVNNHTHVLRARPQAVTAKYLNLALSYYPFIPLTTGSTGRRKLTKAALMAAPITVPSLGEQGDIVAEVDRRLSIIRELETEVDANLKRAQGLRQAILAKAFSGAHA